RRSLIFRQRQLPVKGVNRRLEQLVWIGRSKLPCQLLSHSQGQGMPKPPSEKAPQWFFRYEIARGEIIRLSFPWGAVGTIAKLRPLTVHGHVAMVPMQN